jgi:hypothetical protein
MASIISCKDTSLQGGKFPVRAHGLVVVVDVVDVLDVVVVVDVVIKEVVVLLVVVDDVVVEIVLVVVVVVLSVEHCAPEQMPLQQSPSAAHVWFIGLQQMLNPPSVCQPETSEPPESLVLKLRYSIPLLSKGAVLGIFQS